MERKKTVKNKILLVWLQLKQFLLLLKKESLCNRHMRLRGLRSINLVCFTLYSIYIIAIVVIITIGFMIYKIIVYENFMQTYPFSNVPFWKDPRITNKKPLLPILKIEDVSLTDETIVIAACCRNVRKHLPMFQKNVQAIAALFGKYRIYLGESDSYDETLIFLNEWQANDSDHVRVHTDGHQRRRGFSRKFNRKKSLQNSTDYPSKY
jgi:hypothetical protein